MAKKKKKPTPSMMLSIENLRTKSHLWYKYVLYIVCTHSKKGQ